MYQAAMRSVFSELVRQDRLVVVDAIQMVKPKTKDLVKYLQGFNLDRVLILVDNGLVVEEPNNLRLSARNLPSVEVLEVRELNPVSLVRFDKVLATSAAVKAVAERLS
jgi:large subunit ribosomal protein L4